MCPAGDICVSGLLVWSGMARMWHCYYTVTECRPTCTLGQRRTVNVAEQLRQFPTQPSWKLREPDAFFQPATERERERAKDVTTSSAYSSDTFCLRSMFVLEIKQLWPPKNQVSQPLIDHNSLERRQVTDNRWQPLDSRENGDSSPRYVYAA